MFLRFFRSAIACSFFVLIMCIQLRALAQQDQSEIQKYDKAVVDFVGLLLFDSPQVQESLDALSQTWQPGYSAMALEVLRLTRNNEVVYGLFDLLREKNKLEMDNSYDEWMQWLWTQPESKHPHYAQFKSAMYRLIDARFEYYFADQRKTTIRLDEVIWGGVRQDGIPPLRQPEMVSVAQSDYLGDDNVVFGVEIKGDARAYPKRILAWHEMFVDVIGGVNFAGVYCTLCGAVILYETVIDGVEYEMGTSGFLYRSNKLMYDKATQSLWNTTWGRPVIGPLAGKGIELKRSYVVTTTWGEWKRRHPNTTVLSLQTGHRRNYNEGVAYHDYFATDELMFNVPVLDSRLKNKDEILALTFPKITSETLAVSAEYLKQNPIYHDSLGDLKFVVLTDSSGANRVYETRGLIISSYDSDQTVFDSTGKKWRLLENHLIDQQDTTLQRLAAHRAFWFGWYAANTNTRLVY